MPTCPGLGHVVTLCIVVKNCKYLLENKLRGPYGNISLKTNDVSKHWASVLFPYIQYSYNKKESRSILWILAPVSPILSSLTCIRVIVQLRTSCSKWRPKLSSRASYHDDLSRKYEFRIPVGLLPIMRLFFSVSWRKFWDINSKHAMSAFIPVYFNFHSRTFDDSPSLQVRKISLVVCLTTF